MKKIMLFFLPLNLFLLACDQDVEVLDRELTANANCDQTAILDQKLFEDAASSHLSIEDISIQDNCLRVRFSASGCSGESWNLRLIGSDKVKYSIPAQRSIRFVLENKELCKAYITKELTFDISSLRMKGKAVLLNVINTEQLLLYTH